jgi:hypothetical protein
VSGVWGNAPFVISLYIPRSPMHCILEFTSLVVGYSCRFQFAVNREFLIISLHYLTIATLENFFDHCFCNGLKKRK